MPFRAASSRRCASSASVRALAAVGAKGAGGGAGAGWVLTLRVLQPCELVYWSLQGKLLVCSANPACKGMRRQGARLGPHMQERGAMHGGIAGHE